MSEQSVYPCYLQLDTVVFFIVLVKISYTKMSDVISGDFARTAHCPFHSSHNKTHRCLPPYCSWLVESFWWIQQTQNIPRNSQRFWQGSLKVMNKCSPWLIERFFFQRYLVYNNIKTLQKYLRCLWNFKRIVHFEINVWLILA